jgi:hypothetical protein
MRPVQRAGRALQALLQTSSYFPVVPVTVAYSVNSAIVTGLTTKAISKETGIINTFL